MKPYYFIMPTDMNPVYFVTEREAVAAASGLIGTEDFEGETVQRINVYKRSLHAVVGAKAGPANA
jgi:hypothetical protein